MRIAGNYVVSTGLCGSRTAAHRTSAIEALSTALGFISLNADNVLIVVDETGETYTAEGFVDVFRAEASHLHDGADDWSKAKDKRQMGPSTNAVPRAA